MQLFSYKIKLLKYLKNKLQIHKLNKYVIYDKNINVFKHFIY